jgi:pimeloyl-ACP methyl ester carboxylesterase
LKKSVVCGHHVIHRASPVRKLAYTDGGHWGAAKTFVCLPGLLETRANFSPLLALAESHRDCRWISIDHCGRGNSDPLPASDHYSMSLYMQDIEDFLQEYVLINQPHGVGEVFLVGTSMGGILAMHGAKKLQKWVTGIVLNDIGLTLYWWSLYGLYKGLEHLGTSAPDISLPALADIHPEVIKAVQSPSHFDLKYDFDWLGMHFHSLLENFSGRVLLLHNAHSGLCPTDIAQQFKRHVPQLEFLSLDDDRHPAVWTPAACEWLCVRLGLHPALEGQEANPFQLPLFSRCSELPEDSVPTNLPKMSGAAPSPPIAEEPRALDEWTLRQFLSQSEQHFLSGMSDKAMSPPSWGTRIVSAAKNWFWLNRN